MRLGLNLGYFGTAVADDLTLVTEAEKLGYDSVWTAEAYGTDAVTPLAYLAGVTDRIRLGSAILQMPARTPAMTAMTAVTLDKMSKGRFMLGLGVSGPQVVEGWHGRPYGKPLRVTREYVSIVRRILARREPVTFDGEYYQIPYRGEGASGLGKPLKLISKPDNPDLPIYLAAIGPNNVRLAAEIADGWLPIFYSPERSDQVYQPLLEEGFASSGDPTKAARFDVAPSVIAFAGDDIDRARLQAKPMLALYIGGMGAKGRNFYNDLAQRYGYGEAADEIQDLYLAGKKVEATLAVPDALVDEVCLVGPKPVLADRLEAWRDSGVSTLIVSTLDIETMRTIAELAL
jgi:F420-dependent oxidoreductase-like protein